ncbi:uncharacterized protein LOC110772433 [Prunus avium]|uniref:Uncharacterized protein LOC110772433 n=1 Tax=Prunus avium TaxID=42229 RepID=A0A6P5TZF9_PRUAV|nr:uncharacterized protein LOC110772433 [Prunus avium]
MASRSGLSGASVPGGLDVAWKYARPIEGNKHGTICTFCESTFQSDGITRLKYHLAGFDPLKSVKKCKEVPLDIKKEVIAWIKDKESSKQHKKSIEENIRSTAREGYMGNKSSNPVDDDDDGGDEDGYAYPPDMHPTEKEDYLAAIRASKQEEQFRQGGVYGMGSKRFSGGVSVDASDKTKDAKYFAKLLKDVIKEVGPSNVVHIVTDNGSAFVKAGEMMMEWYPIYWTLCAAHCIDLIFEDIGKQESVANVINKARKLTNYIYNHGWLLAQMRIFCQGDLV